MTNKLMGPLVFLCGLAISAVAAWFSIIGLAKIFASAATAVIVMGAALEVGKLASASWLFRNWKIAPGLLKGYLASAVVILMAITSLGIFGYLSKSYDDQIRPVASKQIEIDSVQAQLTMEKDRMKRAQIAMDQINKQIDSLLSTEKAERSIDIRQRQTRERNALSTEMKEATKNVVALQKSLSDLQLQTNSIEHEVGPINFIAKTLFGESDRSAIDKAVQIMIGLLVVVFDPLAIALLLAANFTSMNRRKEEPPAPIQQGPLPFMGGGVMSYPKIPDGEPYVPEIVTHHFDDNGNARTIMEEIPDVPETADEVAIAEPSRPIGSVIYHDDGTKSIKG